MRSKKPTPNTVKTAANESTQRAEVHAQTESTIEAEMTVLRLQQRRNAILRTAEEAKLKVLNDAIEGGELL